MQLGIDVGLFPGFDLELKLVEPDDDAAEQVELEVRQARINDDFRILQAGVDAGPGEIAERVGGIVDAQIGDRLGRDIENAGSSGAGLEQGEGAVHVVALEPEADLDAVRELDLRELWYGGAGDAEGNRRDQVLQIDGAE